MWWCVPWYPRFPIDLLIKKEEKEYWVHYEIAVNLAQALSPKLAVFLQRWKQFTFGKEQELSGFNKILKQGLEFNPKDTK